MDYFALEFCMAGISLATYDVSREKENLSLKSTSGDVLYLFSQHLVYQPAFSKCIALIAHYHPRYSQIG